ncbi:MAG: type II toxin-antitoxin system Phd/YefM family antitoxin [Caulobacteraceae bacterium]
MVDKHKPNTWTVAQAKAKLSEVMEKARTDGPQDITRRGRKTVVVVDAEQWERTSRSETRGNLADFTLVSPLRGSGLKIERLRGGIRDVDL